MSLVLWIGVAIVAAFHPIFAAVAIVSAIIIGGLKL